MSNKPTAEDILKEKSKEFYQASSDYNSTEIQADDFFKEFQKIIYYAMLYRTPEELIHERVDAEKSLLGIKNPQIEKPTIENLKNARNYLSEEEINKVDNTIMNYLQMAEPQLKSDKKLTADDWLSRLKGLLQMNGFAILLTKSKITKEAMHEKVKEEFEKYLKS